MRNPPAPAGSLLDSLASALRSRVRVDDCGDPCILGKRGNIHADRDGVSVYVDLRTKRKLTEQINAIERIGCVKQRGDTEVVVFVEKGRLSPRLAGKLRKLLRVPKVREVSAETKARLQSMSAAYHASRQLGRASA